MSNHKGEMNTFRSLKEPGYIYLVKMDDRAIYKIGASKNPHVRTRGIQENYGYRVSLIGYVKVDNCDLGERCASAMFIRQHIDGEWFAMTEKDADRFCSLTQSRLLRRKPVATLPHYQQCSREFRVLVVKRWEYRGVSMRRLSCGHTQRKFQDFVVGRGNFTVCRKCDPNPQYR